jgi:hypothetical protein
MEARARSATSTAPPDRPAAGIGSLAELMAALAEAAPYFIGECFCDFSWCFEVSACAAELVRRRGFAAQVLPYSLIAIGPESASTAGLSPQHWHTLLTREDPSTPPFSTWTNLASTSRPRGVRLAHVALFANDGVRGAFADLTIGQLVYSGKNGSAAADLPVTLWHMGAVDTDHQLEFGSWRLARLPPMWSPSEMKLIAKRVAKIDVSEKLPVLERLVNTIVDCSRNSVDATSLLGASPRPTARCRECDRGLRRPTGCPTWSRAAHFVPRDRGLSVP